MKKNIAILLLLLVMVSLNTNMVLAAGSGSLFDLADSSNQDDLIQKSEEGINFFVNKVLPLVGLVAIAVAAVYLMLGSEQGKSKVIAAILGIALLAMAPKILGAIFGIFGSAK